MSSQLPQTAGANQKIQKPKYFLPFSVLKFQIAAFNDQQAKSTASIDFEFEFEFQSNQMSLVFTEM